MVVRMSNQQREDPSQLLMDRMRDFSDQEKVFALWELVGALSVSTDPVAFERAVRQVLSRLPQGHTARAFGVTE